MRARIVNVIVAASIGLGVCPSAFAQTPRPERPYRGLFGGNGADPNKIRQLDLTVTLYGGYDDNILAAGQGGLGEQSVADPRFQASGSLGGAQVGLDFTRRTERVSVDFSLGSAYRYYPTASRFSGFNSWGGAGFSVDLTSRTTLRASEAIYYSPFYSLGSFTGLSAQEPGAVVAINPEYALFEQPAITYYSTAALTHQLTSRANVGIDYNLRYTDFRSDQQSLQDTTAGGLFTYRLTRRATARLGYHYRRGAYGLFGVDRRPVESHDIDAGVDYSRALSISRKTTFGFSTGSSIYKGYRGAGSGGSDPRLDGTRYMVTGNAYLNRQVGRSWDARLEYRRGMQFVEGFPDPFFSDTVSTTLEGFAGPRTRLSFGATYTSGDVGVLTDRSYDTYNANAHAQLAATRWLAFYADYFFYHYKFAPGVVLPFGIGRGLDRNGVRVGVNLWAPLLR